MNNRDPKTRRNEIRRDEVTFRAEVLCSCRTSGDFRMMIDAPLIVIKRVSARAMGEYPNVCADHTRQARIGAILDQYGDEALLSFA